MATPQVDRPCFRPQSGRQEAFLSTDADICVYGGGAGSGKTYAELLDLCRWVNHPSYRGVLFRRTSPQLTTEGGVWDESHNLYPHLGGRSTSQRLRWRFPSGAAIRFQHQQHVQNLERDTTGLQADLIAIDQLEEFEAKQFFYFLSRNRGSAPVNSYMRATANPRPGWLANFLQWWWNPDTGYPIPGRSGVKRWFARVHDRIEWGDSAGSLVARLRPEHPWIKPDQIKSFTFIPATIHDNPILLAKNPGYLAGLMGMREVDKQRLLLGNWLIQDDDGCMWPAEYFEDIYAERWPDADSFELKIIAIDPVTDHKGKDDAAIVFLGLKAGLIYVDADVERIPASELPYRTVNMAAAYLPEEIGIESDGFAGLLAGEFERYIDEQGYLAWPIHPMSHHSVPKPRRIQRLGGMFRARKLRFRRGSPGCERLLSQCRSYGLKGAKDDGPDALEMGLRRLRELAAQLIGAMEADD